MIRIYVVRNLSAAYRVVKVGSVSLALPCLSTMLRDEC